ncbi:hypothetical protein GG344DRAFT_18046, partial [Lentinula edodes]
MTKMVNLLATKLELGSPMICLYLLHNPDHYTSHNFIPFYWRTFVSEARKVWHSDDSHNENKVVILKKKGSIKCLSSTYDYTYRPEQHHNINLYDWTRKYARHKSSGKFSRSEDVDPDCNIDNNNVDSSHSNMRFLPSHPLASSHVVRASRNWEMNVPNFVGGPFPRPDKEDREYYCSAILTLFKPWRTGKDLKSKDQSWHEAFQLHIFNDQEQLYIKNLNLRYECLDARDDYWA